MGTAVDSPREIVDRWLTTSLLAATPDLDTVRVQLTSLGVGSVALHGDLYRPGDRAALTTTLTTLLGEPTESTDGGEHLLLWSVPDGDIDARATWEVIRGR